MGYALRRMWLPQRVASLLWNQWQVCRGMRGNFAMESVASFAWNQWQLSYGTGGNFRAEYAVMVAGVHLAISSKVFCPGCTACMKISQQSRRRWRPRHTVGIPRHTTVTKAGR